MRLGPRRALILGTALVLGLAARSDGEAIFVSRIVWTTGDPAIGGWSGLDLTPDGADFAAITDKGVFATGALRRNGAGRIIAVVAGPMRDLGNSDDDIFRRDVHDAEGLARAPDGRVLVSFEVIRRVLSYPDATVTDPTVLPTHLHFIGMAENAGLEALAIGPDGALYTLPERVRGGGPYPVFRFDGETWALFAQVENRGDGFAPVGADVGPDGRFYLLERKLSRRVGFSTRVRRYEISGNGLSGDGVSGDGVSGNGFSGEATLLRSRAGTHDNLEGLAVWRDGSGRLRLTMISDDNLNRWQKTEIVEYVLPR